MPNKDDADSGKDSRAAHRVQRIEDMYPIPVEDTTKDDKPNEGDDSENGNDHENENQHENGNENGTTRTGARMGTSTRTVFYDAASVIFHEYLTSAGGCTCPDQQRILVATIKQLKVDLGIDENHAAMWTMRSFFSLPMFNNNYFGMVE
ncbi:hypothetical protein AAVH_38379, partial [Aphelenchoides avenae]